MVRSRIPYDPPAPYPDPEADALPPSAQGPNEQSITASGMTVEEWKRKHPRQVMGPEPEEVGQVTADPPDDSPPATPFPGTGTSVDPHGVFTAEFERAPTPVTQKVQKPDYDADAPEVEGIPRDDLADRGRELIQQREEGDLGQNPVEPVEPVQDPGRAVPQHEPNAPVPDTPEPEGDDENDGEPDDETDSTEAGAQAPAYRDATRHDQLDVYVDKHDLQVPQEWSSMTIAMKKDWLDSNT